MAREGDFSPATKRVAIERRETLRETLGESWPPGMANDLAKAYWNRALLHRALDQPNAALADIQKSSELALATAMKTGSFEALDLYLDGAMQALALRSQVSPSEVLTATEAIETAITGLMERHPADHWPPRLQAGLQLLLDLCQELLKQDPEEVPRPAPGPPAFFDRSDEGEA